MTLKASTFARFIFSNANTRIASSFSNEIPFCTTNAMLSNKFIRQIHRTINKSNDSMSPEGQLPSQKPVSEHEQVSLDHMVNSYPTARRFIAIGSGGDDFADAMVLAVESVLQESIPDVCVWANSNRNTMFARRFFHLFSFMSQASVRKRLSSMGRYISVNIGPVQVISRDQVKAVYEAMMKDARMRYFF